MDDFDAVVLRATELGLIGAHHARPVKAAAPVKKVITVRVALIGGVRRVTGMAIPPQKPVPVAYVPPVIRRVPPRRPPNGHFESKLIGAQWIVSVVCNGMWREVVLPRDKYDREEAEAMARRVCGYK